MTPQNSFYRITWRAADIVRAATLIMAVYVIGRLLYFAHVLVFVAFLGVLFGLAVSSAADYFQRFRIPRSVSAATIVIGFVGLLVGFGLWTGPTIQKQYRELKEKLPQAFVKLDHWIEEREGGIVDALFIPDVDSSALSATGQSASQSGKIATQIVPSQRHNKDTLVVKQEKDSLTHVKSLGSSILGQMSGAKRYLFPVISSTFAAFSGIVLVLFLAIYIGINPDLYRRGILALVPIPRRPRWDQLLTASATALRRWLVTQLIAMLAIGVVTTGVLFMLDVPAALPLGILAGLLEFVPTIGPVLSSIPSIAMGFTVSPEKAAAVGVAYILIQFIENHVLIPLLMKESVDLPPALTILFQAVMALVFGFMGLFVAVPILVLAMVFIKTLYVEDVIGHDRRVPHQTSQILGPSDPPTV